MGAGRGFLTPGDIYWVELPVTGGREQAGRRPAIVLQDDSYAATSPLVVVVPLTTATSATRFQATLLLTPTVANGLSAESVALVFQIRAVDRNTLRGFLGNVTQEQLRAIHGLLDRLTGRSVDT